MITIMVGENETKYTIQPALLTNASKWFVEAPGEGFIELRFVETDLEFIEYLLYYLLRGAVPLNIEMPGDDDEIDYLKQRLAVCLWVFGDKHSRPKLQNHAVRHLHSLFHRPCHGLKMDSIREALETSPDLSRLHNFMMGKLVAGLRKGPEDRAAGVENSVFGYAPRDLQALESVPGVMMGLVELLAKILPKVEDRWGNPALSKVLVYEPKETWEWMQENYNGE